jgi:hypothetical protein
VFGVGFVRDPCSVKRWLNLASTPSRRVVREREGLYVFVEYEQGSRGKVFKGLGWFEGYFAK